VRSVRQAWTLARSDLRYLLRQRETLVWTFVMPIVFFFFIGNITGGFGGSSSGVLSAVLVDVPESAGFLGDRFVDNLGRDFRVVRADTVSNPEAWRRRILIPENFTATILAGESDTLSFLRNGTGLNSEYDGIRIQRAAYTVLADMIVPLSRDEEVSPATLARVDSLPRNLTLQISKAGVQRDIPVGFSQAVPGTMVMFTLLIMLSSGAILLVIERREGLLRRLAVSPMSRAAVVGGKWGARLGLGMIQISFAMLIGAVLFKMDWGSNIPMLVVVLVVYASLCASLGILLGNLARTENQAVAVGIIASNVLAALGGCWWPIEIVPRWMQQLALFLPTGITMDALHRLVTFGDPSSAVLGHVAVLAGATVVVGAVSARIFRYQ